MTIEHSKPVRLAAAAWQYALADKYESAGRMVKRISDECGGEGLAVALRGWCDTYADHARDGAEDIRPSQVNFIRTDTGQLDREDSERVPDDVRWAGQLIAARAELNQERWSELLAALPDDGAAIGRHVIRVLEMTAGTVNGLPRGFARMGRPR